MKLDSPPDRAVNPASRDIDTRADGRDAPDHQSTKTGRLRPRWPLRSPGLPKRWTASWRRFGQAGACSILARAPAAGWAVLDAAECPPTFQVAPELVQGIIAGGEAALARATEASEDDPEGGRRDLAGRGFTAGDVLVGIAASGRTPYVLGAVAAARALGAVTIGISCTPDSQLSRAVDIAITPLCGPEVIAGSTRMKAGTATKLVLNMLSTAAMIRLGHVYGNLMVNVRPATASWRIGPGASSPQAAR